MLFLLSLNIVIAIDLPAGGKSLGLIAVHTVNLKELACFFSGAAELDSTYRRLQRFFAEVKLSRHVIAQVVVGLFYLPEQGFFLSLDRTNWCWGKANINILVLSACYRGSAIPVILERAGQKRQF